MGTEEAPICLIVAEPRPETPGATPLFLRSLCGLPALAHLLRSAAGAGLWPVVWVTDGAASPVRRLLSKAGAVVERSAQARRALPLRGQVAVVAAAMPLLRPESLRRLCAPSQEARRLLARGGGQDALAGLLERGVAAVRTTDGAEALALRSESDLVVAEAALRARILDRWIAGGVTIEDPATTLIGADVRIGAGTVIRSHTVIDGPSRIGTGCRIGPFTHIRENVVLGDGASIGNFVEVVRSELGEAVRVRHLTFIGDARVGANTNIGAGTITANSDGLTISKHRTVIGERVSVGSGTVFVAPVRMGDGAKTGAGAVLPAGRDVPAGATVAGVPARELKRRPI